jgi:hypothetical protein
MKLFNKTIDRQLFKQYSLGSDLSKQEVVVKIFNPTGQGNWFILNSDPEDPDYLWAIVDLGYGAEVGSVSRSELENYRGRFGLGFERDLGFDPINAEELYKGLRRGEYYADGGNLSRDRKFLNHSQKYEVRYSRGKNRKGYGYANGGETENKDTWQNILENFGFKKGRSKYGLEMYYKKGYIVSIDKELRNVDFMFDDNIIYKGYSIQGFLNSLENEFGKRNFANGGEVSFIEYKDFEIMYEPNYEKYYANDVEFNSIEEAKKFLDSGEVSADIRDAYSKGLFAYGGEIEVVYERRADFKKKPIKLLLLSRGREQKGYTFSGKEQVAVLENYNRNNQEDLEKLWNLKGYESKYADGGGIEEYKPYVFYFYYDENEMTFNTLEEALKEAKQYGAMKVRDNLGGEYFLNYADGGEVKDIKGKIIGTILKESKTKGFENKSHNNKVLRLLKKSGDSESYGVQIGRMIYSFDNINEAEKEFKLLQQGYRDNFAKGGSLGNYDVVIDGDWDEPKKFKTFSLAKKWIYQNAKNYESLELVDPYGDTIFVEGNSTKEDLDWLFSNDEVSAFAKGGDIESFSDNQRMIMNQNVEVEHHHEELEDILEDVVPVPAWVVAKMETATQNLSDITHYLDGQKEIMEDQLEGDDDDDDDDEMEEIENKEVVEPINVSAGTKAEMTKKFTDDAWGNLRGFLKGMEGIDLRDDYTFDYKDEQYEVEPIINSDENGVSNAVFTIFDGDGEEVGEVAYSREGGKQKFTANSEFFSWNNAKFEDGGFMNNVYAKGGIVDAKKVNKADEIYREHNRERKEKGIENFSKESVALWNEKYNDRLEKLKLTLEEKNALNPKKWYADGGYFDGTIPKVSTYMSTYAKGGEVAKGEILGLKKNILGTTSIEMKISGMRKPQVFSVYPIGKDDTDKIITIQSETRIGKIDLGTGRGLMSQSHSNGAYFVHFQMDKLTPFTISESDLEELKMHIFRTAGSNVGTRGIVSDNSGASRLFANGGGLDMKYYVIDVKYGKVLSKGFDTEEEAKVEKFEIFEKTNNFFLSQKKMSKNEADELSEKQYAKGGDLVKTPFGHGEFLWFFNWKDGGFNEVYAETKAKAIKKATQKGYPTYMPDNEYARKRSLQDIKDQFGQEAVDYIRSQSTWSNEDQKYYSNKDLKLTDVGFSVGLVPMESTFRKQTYDDSRETTRMGNMMTMADGGGIGFIPMNLEEDLRIIAKWGGTDIKGVIGILNAMIDSGVTNEDLIPKPTKNTPFQIEKATEKKIQEIWNRIKPNYKGDFKGNMYYSTLKEMISRNWIYKDVLTKFKPFRKYQKDSFADGGFLDKYEVDRFKQVMNGKAIAKYIVRLQDSYGNKETYVFGIKLKDQFKGCELVPYEVLYGSWSDSGSAFALSNLQVKRLVPNSFSNIELDEQETEMLVNKLVNNNQAGVEKFLNSQFFYLNYNQTFKDVLRGHLALSVARISSVEFEIVQKFADGGKIKLGDVVEVKEPNYGYDETYYVVDNKAGYDEKGFLISETRKRVGDVFEEEQLNKLYADGGFMNDVYAKGGGVKAKFISTPIKEGDVFYDKPNAKAGYYNYRVVNKINGDTVEIQVADTFNSKVSKMGNPYSVSKKYVQNIVDERDKEKFIIEQEKEKTKNEIIQQLKLEKYKGGDLNSYIVQKDLYEELSKFTKYCNTKFSEQDKKIGGTYYGSTQMFSSKRGRAITLSFNSIHRGGYYEGSTPYIVQIQVGGSLESNLKQSLLRVGNYILKKYFFNNEYGDSKVGETSGTNWSSVMLTSPEKDSRFFTIPYFNNLPSYEDGGFMNEVYADGGVFEEEQLNKLYADGGFMNDVYADGGALKIKDLELYKWYNINGKKLRYFGERNGDFAFQTEHYQEVIFKKSQLGKFKIINIYADGGNLDVVDLYNDFYIKGYENKAYQFAYVPEFLGKETVIAYGLGLEDGGKRNKKDYKSFEEAISKAEQKTNKPKYINHDNIKTVTLSRKGKEVTYKGDDVLNDANVLAEGGDISSKANYIPKRDVVEVELKDGTKIKPVNGYWVKKGAEPIGAEPTPTSSVSSEPKIGTTEIKKDPRGNWRAETKIQNFNNYDWKITTIKTSSGNLLTSAQGGKYEQGNGYTTFKFTVFQDPNHTLEVSKPKRLTDKVVSEQHNKGLDKFKKFMETGMFKGGGKISNFDKLSDKVAKQYEGKPVQSKYQEEYGKYYSKEEAQEVGDKVAGKVKAMQSDKKMSGGETQMQKSKNASEMFKKANELAKKIRKEGESWNDAKKRAFAQLKG